MAQIVQPSRRRWLSGREPFLARLTALPRLRRKAKDFDFDAAAFEGARENIGTACRDHDRTAAHRARIVEKQRHHGVAEFGVAFALVRQRAGWIGDDARQACGVEHAFFEIEIPAAVLLREKLALQFIGEFRDGSRKRFQLFVEECAQALQFFGRRKLGRADLFVVSAGVNLVAECFRVLEDGHVRTPRRGRLVVVDRLLVHLLLLGVARVDHLLGFREIAFGRLVFALLVFAVGAFLVGVFRLIRRAVLGAVVAFVFLFALLRLLGQIDKIENLEQVANLAAELLLIFRQTFEAIEQRAAARFDQRPPDVDEALRRRGRRKTGQAFANEQGERIFERRFGTIEHRPETPVTVLVFETGREIRRHAGHAHCAEPFDTSAFGRFEHGAGRSGRRRDAPVNLGVVATDLQREAIGPTACQCDVLSGRRARRLGDVDGLSRHVAFTRSEIDLDGAVSSDRAHGRAKHAFQRL